MYRVSPFVRHFARALIAGLVIATLWVNLSPASYYDLIEWRLARNWLPDAFSALSPVLTPRSLVSEALMALFLFFIAKELWEALVLERGAFSGKRARLPAGAMIGSWIGAVVIWLIAGHFIETAYEATPGIGWQLPLGSDVVLCYVIGRLVFAPGHPGLHLLLLITIASDIFGLIVLGMTAPGYGLQLGWLLVSGAAVWGVWLLSGRFAEANDTEVHHRRAAQLWPYWLAGALSWLGVVLAGLPGALGLLPIIPAIPHASRAFGLFAEAETMLHDPLNRMAHSLVKPSAIILFLYGFTHGGIDLAAAGPTSLTVVFALWLGKPLGLIGGAALSIWLFAAPWPQGLRFSDLLRIAAICGMGFTIPVLAAESVLPGGEMAEAARFGLAISLLIGPATRLILGHRK